MNLIAISGKKKTGKDTVYNYIVDLYPDLKVVRLAFADALKEEIAKACNVTVEYINQHKDNFRLILQGWGTDFRRMLNGKDYWVDCWRRKFYYLNEANIVVATDCRFLNEAEHIRRIGGYVIRVNRFTGTTDTDLHASETELDKFQFDYVINNDGSLEDLRVNVKHLLEHLHTLK